MKIDFRIFFLLLLLFALLIYNVLTYYITYYNLITCYVIVSTGKLYWKWNSSLIYDWAENPFLMFFVSFYLGWGALFPVNNAITEVTTIKSATFYFKVYLSFNSRTTCASMCISLIGVNVFGIINIFLILEKKKTSDISLKPCTLYQKQFYSPFPELRILFEQEYLLWEKVL